VLWLWQILWHRTDFGTDRTWPRFLPVLPVLIALACGGSYFVGRQLEPPHSPEFLRSIQKINQIADYIFTTSRAAHLAVPNVGVDRIVDFIDGRILRVMCYERHKTWITFGVHLPDSILAGPDETVLFKLRHSDFMILTNYAPNNGYWPYDQQMQRLYPELRAWCDDNLVLVDNFYAFGRNMTFYQRRGLP